MNTISSLIASLPILSSRQAHILSAFQQYAATHINNNQFIGITPSPNCRFIPNENDLFHQKHLLSENNRQEVTNEAFEALKEAKKINSEDSLDGEMQKQSGDQKLQISIQWEENNKKIEFVFGQSFNQLIRTIQQLLGRKMSVRGLEKICKQLRKQTIQLNQSRRHDEFQHALAVIDKSLARNKQNQQNQIKICEDHKTKIKLIQPSQPSSIESLKILPKAHNRKPLKELQNQSSEIGFKKNVISKERGWRRNVG